MLFVQRNNEKVKKKLYTSSPAYYNQQISDRERDRTQGMDFIAECAELQKI